MEVSQGLVLRLYMGESDKHGAHSLHDWIIKEAQKQGLSGATVFRGITGFGKHQHIHTTNVLVLSTELPMVVEIIDTEDKIHAFLNHIDKEVTHGYATITDVQICHYGSRDD
ncbi:MAG: DUF190 domain-containing protein [Candidatus Melainabacteria bacterium]|nr:DUF190 domain-containing protein [Candidatus Melainabacteria bacterium]